MTIISDDVVTPAAETMTPEKVDLVVTGVGTATPLVAGLLADSTGLPIKAVVDAIYRAPGRLLIGVPAPDAQRLMELLAPPGLGLAVQPAGGAPAHQPVRDVAIELVDLAAADEAAAALGQFSGLDGERALEMMLTPPCIVLDYVAPPTVDALAAALPQGGGGAPRF